MPEQILADDNDGKTCGCHVLLRARIDNAEAGNVDRLGEDAGGHIGNERDITGIGDVIPLCSVDGVVEADVDIVRVGTEVVSRQARDIGVVLILGGGDDLDVAVLCSLLGCLLGELTGNNVVSLAGAGEQVICYRGKLCGGSALEEEDLIVIGECS